MLNDDERRRLATIEEALLGDPELSAFFRRTWPVRRRRRWSPARCMISSGVLVMAASLGLWLMTPFVQGLGLVALGLTWWAVTSPGARAFLARRVSSWLA